MATSKVPAKPATPPLHPIIIPEGATTSASTEGQPGAVAIGCSNNQLRVFVDNAALAAAVPNEDIREALKDIWRESVFTYGDVYRVDSVALYKSATDGFGDKVCKGKAKGTELSLDPVQRALTEVAACETQRAAWERFKTNNQSWLLHDGKKIAPYVDGMITSLVKKQNAALKVLNSNAGSLLGPEDEEFKGSNTIKLADVDRFRMERKLQPIRDFTGETFLSGSAMMSRIVGHTKHLEVANNMLWRSGRNTLITKAKGK